MTIKYSFVEIKEYSPIDINQIENDTKANGGQFYSKLITRDLQGRGDVCKDTEDELSRYEMQTKRLIDIAPKAKMSKAEAEAGLDKMCDGSHYRVLTLDEMQLKRVPLIDRCIRNNSEYLCNRIRPRLRPTMPIHNDRPTADDWVEMLSWYGLRGVILPNSNDIKLFKSMTQVERMSQLLQHEGYVNIPYLPTDNGIDVQLLYILMGDVIGSLETLYKTKIECEDDFINYLLRARDEGNVGVAEEQIGMTEDDFIKSGREWYETRMQNIAFYTSIYNLWLNERWDNASPYLDMPFDDESEETIGEVILRDYCLNYTMAKLKYDKSKVEQVLVKMGVPGNMIKKVMSKSRPTPGAFKKAAKDGETNANVETQWPRDIIDELGKYPIPRSAIAQKAMSKVDTPDLFNHDNIQQVTLYDGTLVSVTKSDARSNPTYRRIADTFINLVMTDKDHEERINKAKECVKNAKAPEDLVKMMKDLMFTFGVCIPIEKTSTLLGYNTQSRNKTYLTNRKNESNEVVAKDVKVVKYEVGKEIREFIDMFRNETNNVNSIDVFELPFKDGYMTMQAPWISISNPKSISTNGKESIIVDVSISPLEFMMEHGYEDFQDMVLWSKDNFAINDWMMNGVYYYIVDTYFTNVRDKVRGYWKKREGKAQRKREKSRTTRTIEINVYDMIHSIYKDFHGYDYMTKPTDKDKLKQHQVINDEKHIQIRYDAQHIGRDAEKAVEALRIMGGLIPGSTKHPYIESITIPDGKIGLKTNVKIVFEDRFCK